jgi:hypothetical protein
LVVGHVGWFQSLAIVNSAAIKHACASASLVHWLTLLWIYVQECYRRVIR